MQLLGSLWKVGKARGREGVICGHNVLLALSPLLGLGSFMGNVNGKNNPHTAKGLRPSGRPKECLGREQRRQKSFILPRREILTAW